MLSLISLPHTKAFVRTQFLRQKSGEKGFIPCYLIAVAVVLNESPKLMVLTEGGAAFCYVPPQAVCFREDAPEKEIFEVCSWDCLADSGEIVELAFFKHWTVEYRGNSGRYLWTLHFDPNHAWGRLPDQLKLFHFIEGSDGNLYIGVNNEMRWTCKAVTTATMVNPESNLKTWFSEND